MFHFLLLLYVFLLIARVWCNTCSDYILWQLDGETWVACLHGVGDVCNLVVALHVTAIDGDAVALHILHAQALVNGHDSAQVKDALQHRLLCILVDGEAGVQRLAWRSANELIPVEVKANTNRAKSMRQLIKSDTYTDIKHGIKLMAGNVGISENIVTFPYFCTFLLKRYMGKQNLFQ